MKLGRKLNIYLIYFLSIVILILLSKGSYGFIFGIAILEVPLIAWYMSKGVWVIKPNYGEATKWTKSLRFNTYLFFLLIHSVSGIYYWIVRPSYIDTDWTTLIFVTGAIWFGSLALNFLALFVFVKKGVSQQILLIRARALWGRTNLVKTDAHTHIK